MELTIYDIIQGPVISDKAYSLNKELKKLVLRVHPAANKVQVAQALERLFNVKVEKVSIIVRKGKNRRVARMQVTGATTKKAIITLAAGYSLDLFDQAGTSAVPAEQPTAQN